MIAGVALRIRTNEIPWDLIIVMGLASLLFAVIILAQTGPIRVILGLAFALFFPGYAIVSALFLTSGQINTIERIALSFGLSITVVPLIGLLLNYSRWGFNLYPILVSLIAFTIILCVIAWFRRSKIPFEERFYIKITMALPTKEELLTLDKILSILIVISIIIAVFTAIYITVLPKKGEKYTEFYIFDENGTTENYPKYLTIGEPKAVIVGIFCHEYKRTIYAIEITLLNLTGERTNMTLKRYNVTLEQDTYDVTVFNFTVNDNGTYKLQFLLYIDSIEEPYRELHLWINVKS